MIKCTNANRRCLINPVHIFAFSEQIINLAEQSLILLDNPEQHQKALCFTNDLLIYKLQVVNHPETRECVYMAPLNL